jgi:hypothetical protein
VTDHWFSSDSEDWDDQTNVRAECDRYEEGLQLCRQIVDESLEHTFGYCAATTPDQLYQSYMTGGSNPFIYPCRGEQPEFDADEYAKERSKVIFGRKKFSTAD